jgi:hypothetical protein
MATFYEILKIAPSASQVEIEAAIDKQYNQWRRLVTHHDAGVVEEANHALRLIEQIRSTITDPVKRTIYDSTLNIGGLADPEAILRAATPHDAPPTPKDKQSGSRSNLAGGRPDAWVCLKCQTTNPLKTKFCSKCGQQLGLDCPNCGKLTKSADPFCAECGVNLNDCVRQRQVSEMNWLPAVKDEIARGGGQPVTRTFLIGGSHDEIFNTMLNIIKETTSLGFKVFVIKEVDQARGYIVAGASGDLGLSKIQVFVQPKTTLERFVVISSSRIIQPIVGRSYQVNLISSEMRKRLENLKAIE